MRPSEYNKDVERIFCHLHKFALIRLVRLAWALPAERSHTGQSFRYSHLAAKTSEQNSSIQAELRPGWMFHKKDRATSHCALKIVIQILKSISKQAKNEEWYLGEDQDSCWKQQQQDVGLDKFQGQQMSQMTILLKVTPHLRLVLK